MPAQEASAGAPVTPASPTVRLRIRFEQEPRQLLDELKLRGLDVTYVNAKRGTLDVMGGEAEVALLRTLGFDPQPADGPLAPEALSDYLSPSEIEARLAQFESAYPSLAKRVAYATDHEGRTAWAMKISDNVTVEEDEPAVLYVAQHHAREVMTPEVAIDTIDQLLSQYGTDPTIARWVDGSEIWVLPSHNPDGASYVFTNEPNWRKNRRNNGDGSFGVDLNRNYPQTWNACGGSSGSPGSDTYRGPSPGSEPTNIGLINLARQQRPVYYISYHTYGGYTLHPYGCESSSVAQPDFRLFRELANVAASRMQGDVAGTWFQFGTPWELLYSVDGDTDGWMYGDLGAVGVTYELNSDSQGFQPDYATWRETTVQRARAGWRYTLELLDAPRLTGHVKDACTGAALPGTTIALVEQVFTNGELPRTTTPDFARYDWPVLPGNYTLQASKSGYAAQSWPSEVGSAPLAREVFLVPTGAADAAVRSARVVESGGDGDGRIDPGETVDLFLSAYATGGALADLTATVTTSDPYLTVPDGATAFGALAAGETREALAGDPVRVAFAAETPDGYEAEILVDFGGSPEPCGAPRRVTLRVTTGSPSCPSIEENLDGDPGWQIDNGTFSNGWEFGPPSLAGPGPTAAFTGTNVYGTNLDGNYSDGAAYFLTAGPYDLSTLRHAELRFARWLQSETGFDIARVEIQTGGSGAWQPVWEGFGRDTAWVPVRYDISALADGEAEVYVRFSLSSDGGSTGPGFYLDDLTICGEQLPNSTPRVKYRSHVLDDSNPAYGNGNGLLDPGETAVLRIETVNSGGAPATLVSAVLTPVSPGVVVHDAVADYPDMPAGTTAFSLSPHFSVRLTGPCGPDVVFKLTTRWAGGGTTSTNFTVVIGDPVEATLIDDTFQTDKGWSVGGTTTAGRFERLDPNGYTDPTAGPVQPEDDRTPAPGTLCWITGNAFVGPGFDPRTGDVDRGRVHITSPVFNGLGEGRLILSFSRFYHRSGVGFLQASNARAKVSTDGGTTYATIEDLSSNAAAWTDVTLDLGSFVTRTASMRVRFEAEETSQISADPLTELLIDDVRVVRQYDGCFPFAPSETRPPNPVGATLRAERLASDVALAWTAPAADAQHDAARFYPVYRSATAVGGYGASGEPTSTAWRDTNGGAAGGTAFYLVAAKNAAGTSGEEPTP